MKDLRQFVFEKFKLNSDSDYTESDPKDPTTWKVGDILYVHWGGSMSLVDFYEIVRNTGKSIYTKQLKDKIVSGSFQNGKIEPVFGKYESDKIIQSRISRGHVKIENGYGHIWDGKPMMVDRMD